MLRADHHTLDVDMSVHAAKEQTRPINPASELHCLAVLAAPADEKSSNHDPPLDLSEIPTQSFGRSATGE